MCLPSYKATTLSAHRIQSRHLTECGSAGTLREVAVVDTASLEAGATAATATAIHGFDHAVEMV